MYNLDKDGKTTSIQKVTYLDPKDYGPLGNGTYTVYMNADGTFSESFEPGEGNVIKGFKEEGISQKKFVDNTKDFPNFEKRLNGRLIEGVVENALIAQGFDETDVRNDVEVLVDAPDAWMGYFATFEEGTSEKYVKKWESGTVSPPHKSKEGKTSSEIGSTDVLIKFYDGAESSTDNISNQIGLVREGIMDHGIEATDAAINSSTNIGVENATRVKMLQETKVDE